ncbi:MAG: hypothetical protein AB7K09_06855 [Planctomycetota bacterium]
MYTPEQLIASLQHEVNIIKHLGTKVTADLLHYRPSETQRTLLDLMQYLTTCAIVPARYMATGNWDEADELEQAAGSVMPETFAAAMDQQMSRLAETIRSQAPADFETARQMPWGAPCTMGQGLVDASLVCIAAYRMQFFLYLKAAGLSELGSAQCWVGRDPKPPAASAE